MPSMWFVYLGMVLYRNLKHRLKSAFLWTILLFLSATTGCNLLRKGSKYEFSNGYYRMKHTGPGKEKVYVDQQDGEYAVYRVEMLGQKHAVDTAASTKLLLPLSFQGEPPADAVFWQPSLDLDFLTIPLKYRPSLSSFPRQLNTNLNGGAYIGFRNDVYHLRYSQTPLGKPMRHTTHFGFSFGGFAGLGATAMNPSVTNDQVPIEYDGVILTKGVAGILGVNHFTVGLAIGFDNLLDKNRKYWIYRQKPWIGLAFGLNLN